MAGGGVMKRSRTFSSWLAPHFDGFIALKRAGGARYEREKTTLLAFDRYIAEHSEQPPFLHETLSSYLATTQHLSAGSQSKIVGVIWPALTYAESHGVEIEPLPARPPTPVFPWLQRQPRILSKVEIVEIMAAARTLSPATNLRPITFVTLFGLLATTGMRISEALALNVGDLDRRNRILTILQGKFGKIRALPLRESTNQALIAYIEHPLRSRPTDSSAPIFVTKKRLTRSVSGKAFRKSCIAAGLEEPWPRLHDLRHTFAVRSVDRWYEQERDVDKWLPALSTYLGHVSVEKTRRYLTANGTLLQQASRRFERHTQALDEARS